MKRVHSVRRLADHPAPTPQATPCRLWQGQVRKGYGYRGDGSRIHRWVMEQAFGRPLVAGEIVMHKCDNRLCYRFDHLLLGTIADNNADMRAKGRNRHAVTVGEAVITARLTEDDVRYIRSLEVVDRQALAERFGVARQTMDDVVRGRSWKHVR